MYISNCKSILGKCLIFSIKELFFLLFGCAGLIRYQKLAIYERTLNRGIAINVGKFSRISQQLVLGHYVFLLRLLGSGVFYFYYDFSYGCLGQVTQD